MKGFMKGFAAGILIMLFSFYLVLMTPLFDWIFHGAEEEGKGELIPMVQYFDDEGDN